MKYALLLGLIFIISITQCRNLKNRWDGLNPTKNFIRDVPIDKNGNEGLFQSVNFIRDSLKLDNIERGYDGLEIRIWLSYALVSGQQIFIIKNSNNKWSGEYIENTPIWYKQTDSLLFFETKKMPVTPESSWESFQKKLFDFNILTLPDSKKIENFEIASDCNGITIEVAINNEYRMYSYSCVGLNTNKFKEFKDVNEIIELLSKEFKVKTFMKL